ncbi:11374_t:CDS:2 [Cetraspora pellucida]|uniref:11374_t:CDS:1 n=1 Tax=Cetraspora pellucida TaxID=1433469 RepID=A0ACA9KAC5_9GLOM|nr:11374_t:CDS:2 [Cetraspora pellucida]
MFVFSQTNQTKWSLNEPVPTRDSERRGKGAITPNLNAELPTTKAYVVTSYDNH